MQVSETLASSDRLDFSFSGRWEPMRVNRSGRTILLGHLFKQGAEALWAWLRADAAASPHQHFGPHE